MSAAPFSKVVEDHATMVLRVCRSMLPPADADDAWSETFLATLRAYPNLDEHANVAAWLVTIARRKCIDTIRRRDRTAIPTDHRNAVIPSEDQERDLDDDLRVAMNSLSDNQRFAIVAHHVAGLPYAEVATLLETTPTAARRSAADGITKLRSTYRRVP